LKKYVTAAMINKNTQLELLLDLEAKHDDLLKRLAELDKRVEKTLSECLALRQPKQCVTNCIESAQQPLNSP
jgi:hypothetical protein